MGLYINNKLNKSRMYVSIKGGGAVKTIDELVGEVAKNIGAASPALKQSSKQSTTTEVLHAAHAVQVKPFKKEVCTPTDKNNFPERLTIDIAKDIAKAVEIAAGIIGINIVVSICNEGANLIILHAMDDSYIASIRASQDKAYTSAALKMPTHTALIESRGGSLDGLTNGNGLLLLGGGYPLIINNKIYGGIGVSGGSKEQDILLAAVASAYFEARFKGGPEVNGR